MDPSEPAKLPRSFLRSSVHYQTTACVGTSAATRLRKAGAPVVPEVGPAKTSFCGAPVAVPDVIRALALAADPPKKSGSPKKSGLYETVSSQSGKPLFRIEGKDRKGLKLILLPQAGGSREDADVAIKALLDKHWP